MIDLVSIIELTRTNKLVWKRYLDIWRGPGQGEFKYEAMLENKKILFTGFFWPEGSWVNDRLIVRIFDEDNAIMAEYKYEGTEDLNWGTIVVTGNDQLLDLQLYIRCADIQP